MATTSIADVFDLTSVDALYFSVVARRTECKQFGRSVFRAGGKLKGSALCGTESDALTVKKVGQSVLALPRNGIAVRVPCSPANNSFGELDGVLLLGRPTQTQSRTTPSDLSCILPVFEIRALMCLLEYYVSRIWRVAGVIYE